MSQGVTAQAGSEQELVQLRGSGGPGQELWLINDLGVINDLGFVRGSPVPGEGTGDGGAGIAAGPAGEL